MNIEDIEGANDSWTQITLVHQSGEEIAVVERNPVLPGSLGEEEIREFTEEITNCKPETAVKWLKEYFPKIKVIYAFQILGGAYHNKGWDAVRVIHEEFWKAVGGIIQADNEGFSNELGYHILWQFPDSVKGSWYMAVLDSKGSWVGFKMNLGNKTHRKAFLDGKVPDGVKTLTD